MWTISTRTSLGAGAGARILSEPTETESGRRTYVVEDLEGVQWTFYQRFGEPSASEASHIVSGLQRGGMSSTLARVHEIAPAIASRSEEIDRQRRIPRDLLDELVWAGCYRMLTPASHGGQDAELLDVLRVIERLAQADGAVGWAVGQAALGGIIFGSFPAATIDEIYADGPDVFRAGAFAPKGRAARHAGAWQVSGQWPFVTGCREASWLYLNCLIIEDRKIQILACGLPSVRMMLFPASEVEVVDTWDVLGLRGTASHDVRVRKGSCGDLRSYVPGGAPTLRGGMFRIPQMDQTGLFIAAVAVGIAQRLALDELRELAASGMKPTFSRMRLAENSVFHDRLGTAYMSLQAARALLHDQASAAWDRVISERQPTNLEQSTLRATSLHVTTMATQVIDTAYLSAGGTSVYDRSPLQRRLRDIHTATQHAWNGATIPRHWAALLAGARPGACRWDCVKPHHR